MLQFIISTSPCSGQSFPPLMAGLSTNLLRDVFPTPHSAEHGFLINGSIKSPFQEDHSAQTQSQGYVSAHSVSISTSFSSIFKSFGLLSQPSPPPSVVSCLLNFPEFPGLGNKPDNDRADPPSGDYQIIALLGTAGLPWL